MATSSDEMTNLSWRRFEDGSVITYEKDLPASTCGLYSSSSAYSLRIAGDEDPESIEVKGKLGDKTVKASLTFHVEEIDDHGDLRLRWATRRRPVRAPSVSAQTRLTPAQVPASSASRWMRPSRTAVSRASGTDAAEVLPC